MKSRRSEVIADGMSADKRNNSEGGHVKTLVLKTRFTTPVKVNLPDVMMQTQRQHREDHTMGRSDWALETSSGRADNRILFFETTMENNSK